MRPAPCWAQLFLASLCNAAARHGLIQSKTGVNLVP